MKKALVYAAILAISLGTAGWVYFSEPEAAPVRPIGSSFSAAPPNFSAAPPNQISGAPPEASAKATSPVVPRRTAHLAEPKAPRATATSVPVMLWSFDSDRGGASTMVALRQPQIPSARYDAARDMPIVEIAPDWRTRYPFSERFLEISRRTLSSEAVRTASETSHVIDLAAARFVTDSLVSVGPDGKRRFAEPDLRSFAPELVGRPFDKTKQDYFIVQASSPSDQSSLRAFLDASKIDILEYLPDLAYLVRTDSRGLASLQTRNEIFWVGLFHSAYRIDPRTEYINFANPSQQVRLTILVDRTLNPDGEALASSIRGKGINVLLQAAAGRNWLVRTDGPVSNARILATMPGALWVERYVDAELHNDVARTSSNVTTGRGAATGPIMDVEDVWARGIHGENQIAAAADTGLSTGDIATPNSMHYDFGQVGSATNPMRVIQCYALARSGNCNDDQATGGGHGTHTSGSILGNGFRSGATPSTDDYGTSHAGVAPKAQLVFQSIMNSTGGLTLPADLNTMFLQAYNDGARVHSNSWGAAVAGQYNANAQQVDEFSWDHKDMVITFSAGNSGVDSDYYTNSCRNGPGSPDGIIDADSIGSPGTAKNCITVGASENYRPAFVYEYPAATCTANQNTWGWFNGCSYSTAPVSTDLMANNANGMGAFSSRGPTDDGRVKPDIVAPGIAIISTRTNVNQAYEQWGVCIIPAAEQAYYVTQGGTSMSNPLTAGAATLVRQYYADGWHPNNSLTTNSSAVGADGFSPTSALVKATLINGAWDMGPGQYGTGGTKEIPPSWDTGKDLPNNVEGFGRVDVERSLFPGSGYGDDANRKMEVHDVTTGLTTGQVTNYTVTVANANDPLIATLVWTDPYGATAAATELVNNLDLQVTSGVTTWYPNKKDNTAGTADTRNNVEQVYISAPSAGTYTVTVTATAVPGNGVAGTTAQPYALVISGVVTPPCTPPAVPAPTATPGPSVNQITIDWSAIAGASGYYVYRSDGACPGGTFSLVQTINSGATVSWTDSGLTGGSTYSYKVSAFTACESAQSSCTDATALSCSTPQPPSALTTSTPENNNIRLSWTASPTSGVTYTVYRSDGACPGGSFASVATGLSTTTWDDTSVAGGSTYSYYVSAFDQTCESSSTLCADDTATGGPGLYSSAMRATGTPRNTLAGQPARWIYSSSAAAMNPPTVNSAVYAASNDRIFHSMERAATGGKWPRTSPKDWKPLVMNAPSQGRATVYSLVIPYPSAPTTYTTRVAYLASQDGRVYCVDADNGTLLWTSAVLGEMLQGLPAIYARKWDAAVTKLSIDLILVGTRNSSAANEVIGLNAATGAVVWRFDNGGGGSAIGIVNGGIIIDQTKKLAWFASRRQTGGSSNTLWNISFDDTGADPTLMWAADAGDIDGTPVNRGTVIYVGSNEGTVSAWTAEPGVASPSANWEFPTANGAIKEMVFPDYSNTRLYFATTDRVWCLVDNTGSASEAWSTPASGAGSIARPSRPLPYLGTAWIGSSDGSVYKITGITTLTGTPAPVSVGALGNGAVGAPSIDGVNSLLHVGTEGGKMFAVTP